ncbi:MAG: hypothetical protein WCB46_01080 [Methanoregula sp.]
MSFHCSAAGNALPFLLCISGHRLPPRLLTVTLSARSAPLVQSLPARPGLPCRKPLAIRPARDEVIVQMKSGIFILLLLSIAF